MQPQLPPEHQTYQVWIVRHVGVLGEPELDIQIELNVRQLLKAVGRRADDQVILKANHVVQEYFFVFVENAEGFADRNAVDRRRRKDDVRQSDLAIFFLAAIFQEADFDLVRQFRADMVVYSDLVEAGVWDKSERERKRNVLIFLFKGADLVVDNHAVWFANTLKPIRSYPL